MGISVVVVVCVALLATRGCSAQALATAPSVVVIGGSTPTAPVVPVAPVAPVIPPVPVQPTVSTIPVIIPAPRNPPVVGGKKAIIIAKTAIPSARVITVNLPTGTRPPPPPARRPTPNPRPPTPQPTPPPSSFRGIVQGILSG